jgi:hypothetical protein
MVEETKVVEGARGTTNINPDQKVPDGPKVEKDKE